MPFYCVLLVGCSLFTKAPDFNLTLPLQTYFFYKANLMALMMFFLSVFSLKLTKCLHLERLVLLRLNNVNKLGCVVNIIFVKSNLR